jgi:hypothetical protein
MSQLLEYLKRYEVKENRAVEVFLKTLKTQIDALEKGEFNRRSWMKPEGNGYMITLGKLEGNYQLPDKPEAVEFLKNIADNVRSDEEFIALIEKAYGEPAAEVEKPRRGRKPKAA